MALEQSWQASLSKDTKVHYSNNHIDSQPLAQNTEAYTVQKHQRGHKGNVSFFILTRIPFVISYKESLSKGTHNNLQD